MQTFQQESFSWDRIQEAPSESGIYAWYYRLELSDHDIASVVAAVKERLRDGSDASAAEVMQRYLKQVIFNPLKESPYQVSLRGSLKPSYCGDLNHNIEVSGALVRRLVAEPERLRDIKVLLEYAPPNFSAPLYVGMAKNLRTRLRQHRTLIEKLVESMEIGEGHLMDNQDGARDHAFAKEVAKRSLVPSRLFAIIQRTRIGANVDIENILNRVFYPTFGRN